MLQNLNFKGSSYKDGLFNTPLLLWTSWDFPCKLQKKVLDTKLPYTDCYEKKNNGKKNPKQTLKQTEFVRITPKSTVNKIADFVL